MANGIAPAQDAFGLGRLAHQVRLDRQEGRQIKRDEQNAVTQGLQQQLLGGRVQAQQGSLADLAKQRQLQAGAQEALKQDTGKTPEFKLFNYYRQNAPEKALEFRDKAIATGISMLKIDPKKALEFVNNSLGEAFELGPQDGDTVTIFNKGRTKFAVHRKSTGEVLSEGAFPGVDVEEIGADGKKVKLQRFEGIDAQGKPAFFTFNPETRAVKPIEGATPAPKSGEVIETLPGGGVRITRGGAGSKSLGQQKFEEKKKATKEKKAEAQRIALSKIDLVINKVDEGLKNTGFFTTGLLGAPLGIVPGTSARDLKGTIDTIKANLGFTALQQMRDASPTGGALGQVSERELTLLNSAVTSLDTGQSTEVVRRNLEQVKVHFQNWKKAIDEAARRRQFDDQTEQAPPQQEQGEVIETLPEGAVKIGTSKGLNVYQLPNGETFLEE